MKTTQECNSTKVSYCLLLLFSVIFLIGCQQGSKKEPKQEPAREREYQYFEINKVKGIGGSKTEVLEPEVIKAFTDSAAYLEAYKSFCISLRVWKEMEAGLGFSTSTPTNFKLLNDAGVDIVNTVKFQGKEEQEVKIAEKVFSMETGIKESIQKAIK